MKCRQVHKTAPLHPLKMIEEEEWRRRLQKLGNKRLPVHTVEQIYTEKIDTQKVYIRFPFQTLVAYNLLQITRQSSFFDNLEDLGPRWVIKKELARTRPDRKGRRPTFIHCLGLSVQTSEKSVQHPVFPSGRPPQY